MASRYDYLLSDNYLITSEWKDGNKVQTWVININQPKNGNIVYIIGDNKNGIQKKRKEKASKKTN